MSQIDYDTEQEANEDIELYLNHYGDDYPQLYHVLYFEETGEVRVIYNAPWPVESYG